MPSFSRTCLWGNSGVCEADAEFGTVKKLVDQFHTLSVSFKLIGSPFIVRLCLCSGSASSGSCDAPPPARLDPVWLVIGCVTGKPISHIGIRLFVEQGSRLAIKTISNIPCIESMHMVLRDLVKKHRAQNQEDQNISIQVGPGFRIEN